jgi:hypothetical protein
MDTTTKEPTKHALSNVEGSTKEKNIFQNSIPFPIFVSFAPSFENTGTEAVSVSSKNPLRHSSKECWNPG